MSDPSNSIAAIILAAGASSRMGTLKQLLTIDGQTFLERAIRAATGAGCDPIIVISGARREEIESSVKDEKIRIAFNPDWSTGMASSLRTGVRDARSIGANSVAVLLCDQPNISGKIVRALIDLFQTSGKSMAACRYAGVLGPPCCFDSSLFSELESLTGDRGARGILTQRQGDVAVLEFDAGQIDLDTHEQYEKYLNA